MFAKSDYKSLSNVDTTLSKLDKHIHDYQRALDLFKELADSIEAANYEQYTDMLKSYLTSSKGQLVAAMVFLLFKKQSAHLSIANESPDYLMQQIWRDSWINGGCNDKEAKNTLLTELWHNCPELVSILNLKEPNTCKT